MATFVPQRQADGRVRYRARVRVHGHPEVNATFSTRNAAQRWAQRKEVELRESRHCKDAAAKRHTVADMIERYERDVLPLKPKTAPFQKRQLKWWREKIGHLKLAEVTAATIYGAMDELGRGVTKRKRPRGSATINRYVAALSHAFTVAADRWEWLDANPVLKVEKRKEPRGRDRYLKSDERQRLLAACIASASNDLYPVVILGLSTGMRQGEIMGLRWSAIDLVTGLASLDDTKNGERRSVPLHGLALQALRARALQHDGSSDWVFPGEDKSHPKDIRAAWETALRRAKITNFRFHDLRHSAASYMAMSGATTLDIAAVLGHKSLQMVKRYSHLSTRHVSNVVSQMNERVFGHA